jgi:hypothetical protein
VVSVIRMLWGCFLLIIEKVGFFCQAFLEAFFWLLLERISKHESRRLSSNCHVFSLQTVQLTMPLVLTIYGPPFLIHSLAKEAYLTNGLSKGIASLSYFEFKKY